MNKFFNKEFLNECESGLNERLQKIQADLLAVSDKDPRHSGSLTADFPSFGDKEDENASEVAEFEGNLALEETLIQTVEMINRALEKIKDGTYGLCEKCNAPIDQERLKIMPTATKCSPGKCHVA